MGEQRDLHVAGADLVAAQPQTPETRIELATGIHDQMSRFHDTTRRHRALGMLTPTEYEILHRTITALGEASETAEFAAVVRAARQFASFA